MRQHLFQHRLILPNLDLRLFDTLVSTQIGFFLLELNQCLLFLVSEFDALEDCSLLFLVKLIEFGNKLGKLTVFIWGLEVCIFDEDLLHSLLFLVYLLLTKLALDTFLPLSYL
jgi:hypothetical protein